MRYHVLLECDSRPHPIYLTAIKAANDAEAWRLAEEQSLAGERLQIVRQDGDRLVRVPNRE